MLQWIKSTLKGIVDTLLFWKRFESRDELKKFGLLAVIFGVIIGTYWTMRPIKDSIFGAIVGVNNIPYAKMLSLCLIVPLVILYSKLIDWFPRHKVFYGIVLTYAALAFCFMIAFMHPTIGLANQEVSSSRIIGWLWYVFVESYGSLIVALFWAITTDITLPAAAPRGFPVIMLFAQFGQIAGPFFLNTENLRLTTSAPIAGICAGLTVLVAVLFWVFMHVVPPAQLKGYHGEHEVAEKEPGFLEGLKLLLSQGYLLGIFVIVSAFEVIVTIFDFHLKAMAKAQFPLEAANSAYLSKYAYTTGIVSTLCVWFGINEIQRKLGVKASLLLLPVLIGSGMFLLYMNPMSLLVVFWIMVFAKAINYALNQPTIKQLYIPTTKDTKYKATAWIEMFGSRGAKAIGSGVNAIKKPMIARYGGDLALATPAFLGIAAGLSGVVILFWMLVAVFVSKKYQTAVDKNEVVC